MASSDTIVMFGGEGRGAPRSSGEIALSQFLLPQMGPPPDDDPTLYDAGVQHRAHDGSPPKSRPSIRVPAWLARAAGRPVSLPPPAPAPQLSHRQIDEIDVELPWRDPTEFGMPRHWGAALLALALLMVAGSVLFWVMLFG